MSNYLVKQLTDQIIRTLPKEKRDIYNYVMEMEDGIAEEVTTATEFMDYLKIEAPHKMAAHHFELTLFELLDILNEVDIYINQQLTSLLNEVKWIDCTDLVYSAPQKYQKAFFLSTPMQ